MKPLCLIFISLLAGLLQAAEPPVLNRPESSKLLRIAGYPGLAPLAARWSGDFAASRPGLRIESHFTGSDTGMAALYTGKADIALLGRSPTLSEIQAFEWIHRYKPTQVEILTGSLDHPGRSPALVLFVHQDNPLTALSLGQLEALFGAAHRSEAAKPLHLYGPDAMSGTGRFFRQRVLNDSRMMNWEQLTEFSDTGAPHEATHDAGKQILAALSKDPQGLAVASLGIQQPGVRPIAILVDGVPVPATNENLVSRRYPLTRGIVACINRKPGEPIDGIIAAFLRHVLSPAGQRAATEEGVYLPLDAARADDQARLLK